KASNAVSVSHENAASVVTRAENMVWTYSILQSHSHLACSPICIRRKINSRGHRRTWTAQIPRQTCQGRVLKNSGILRISDRTLAPCLETWKRYAIGDGN